MERQQFNMKNKRRLLATFWGAAMFILGSLAAHGQTTERTKKETWDKIKQYFIPPEQFKGELGDYRSLLKFYDGRTVETKKDWEERRAEIKKKWHSMMGEWPEIMADQALNVIDSSRKEGYTQYTVTFKWLPNEETTGYLLIPETKGKKPAVVTVFYEPETAIGGGKPYRDFALQLTKRGFVTLSIGTKETSNNKTYSLYYPSINNASVQPLSMLAYAAANAWQVLAKHSDVDAGRIGIMGHSYGGKWAMFASALYDKYACGVWSDPGIVFDETKGSGVNYWEPWYLGYYPPPWENTWRKTGMIPAAKGLYPTLIRDGYDLHELHALMAPRPFLVSGGSSDPEERWIPLNHTIAVNELLGFKNRVAMTNRVAHSPDSLSNEQAFLFFDYFLK